MESPKPRSRARSNKVRSLILAASMLFAGDLTRCTLQASAPEVRDGQKHAESATSALCHKLALGTRKIAAKLLRSAPPHELRLAAEGESANRLLWPVQDGSFVRGFGYVRKSRRELPHLGVDIAAHTGTAIHAAASGLVAYANNGLKGYGNYLMIVHSDGAVTSYAHCSQLLAKPGQRVERGEVVARVGSTGISKGPHLHFELRLQGKPSNPMERFGSKNLRASPDLAVYPSLLDTWMRVSGKQRG